MIFDFAYAFEIIPMLARAAVVTVAVSVAGFLVALMLGLVGAIGVRCGNRPVVAALRLVIEFVRSTPLLVQIFFLFFIGPSAGIRLSPFNAGVLALGLHYGAYLTEVYRSGFEAVPKGQWEAAASLGLKPGQTMRLVVLRQAVRPIIPALGNYFIAMFKETPLLSSIAVIELMARAKLIAASTFRYVEPITMIGIFFLLMSAAVAFLTRLVDRRLQYPQ